MPITADMVAEELARRAKGNEELLDFQSFLEERLRDRGVSRLAINWFDSLPDPIDDDALTKALTDWNDYVKNAQTAEERVSAEALSRRWLGARQDTSPHEDARFWRLNAQARKNLLALYEPRTGALTQEEQERLL